MSNITQTLVSLGLTETEAELYQAGLCHGPCTVQELAIHTQVKRPTIYHALNTLAEKGLVSEQKSIGKTKYAMSEAVHVRGLLEKQRLELEQKASQLEKIVPILEKQVQMKMVEAQTTQHYYGLEGMKLAMDVAFRATSRHWDIIAPHENFLRHEPEFAKHYLSVRKHRHITSRTLWEFVPSLRNFTPEELKQRNPRIMPAVMKDRFKSMVILFDDKIAIFSSLEKKTAILITSAEIHKMFQAMFDGLWQLSTEPTD
jgi:sugar-specific transcriptional regulator TrmB